MASTQNNEVYIQKLKQRIAALEGQLRTDELTRVLNRRGLMEYLETMVNEVLFQLKYPERRRFLVIKSFSLLFVDLDNFKTINDSYGHQSGDQVLRQVSELIRSELRGIDIVGRYGGEELVVGLIGADGQAAATIADGIRQKIEQQVFSSNEHSFNVTASFGVATLRPEMKLKDLLAQADAAVYQAKDRGRNRVVVYDDKLAARPDKTQEVN